MNARQLSALFIAAGLLTTCGTPQFRTPYDVSDTSYKFTQTFGQFATVNGAQAIAPYVVLQMPAADDVRAFSAGVISYRADFHGMGPTIILHPKAHLSSDTNFDTVEGMPRSAKLKFAIGHLNAGQVQTAIAARYTAMGVTNAAAAAQRFIAGEAGNKELDVEGGATPASGTVIGKSDGGEVRIAAFTGEADNVETFVNPLPFLAAAVPAANLDHLDAVRPQFGDVFLFAADNQAMVGSVAYQVPSSGTLAAPNYLFGHISVVVKVNDWMQAADFGNQTKAVGLYELAYDIHRVEGGGTRTLVHAGRNLMNTLDAAVPTVYAALYNGDRSSAGAHTFAYNLHFDPNYADGVTPSPRNYLDASNPHSLNLSAFANGTYEITLKARDARMAPGDYETKIVTATVTSNATLVAQANWPLTVSLGAESTTVSGSDSPGFLIVSGASLPLSIQAYTTDAPAGLRYTQTDNGVAAVIADSTFAGTQAAPQTITAANGGVHELVVWADQNGDGIRDVTEPSRRMIVMTYEVTAQIAAQRKTGGGAFAAHPEGNLVARGDGLALALSGVGFQFGHEASATFSFEQRDPDGAFSTTAGTSLTIDPLPKAGEYVFTGVVMPFGTARIVKEFRQTVVGAAFAPVGSLCTGDTLAVNVTLTPSPLPGGSQVEVMVAGPAVVTDGAAQFSDGAASKNLNASGPVTIRTTKASTARDNLALVAKFDGVEIAREPFTACKLDILDKAKAPADSLLIGLWENAYDAGPPISVHNTAANDFIELDPRRFYVRVIDHSRAGSSFNVDIGTTGTVSDPFHQVQVIETGVNTGIFDSKSQLLVTDDASGTAAAKTDDGFPAYDGIAGAVADEALGDRTHKTYIDGVVQARYTPSGTAIQTSKSVNVCRMGGIATCDRTKPGTPCKLKYNVTVFLEPFEDAGIGAGNGVWDYVDANGNGIFDAGEPSEAFIDTNGNGKWDPGEPLTDTGAGKGNGRFDFVDSNHNGKHDNGEPSERFIDYSGGKFTMGFAGSYGPVETEANVDALVTRAKLSWWQACVKVDDRGVINNRKAPVDGAGNDVIADGDFSKSLTASADEGLVPSFLGAGMAEDVIEVLFVGNIVGANASSRPPLATDSRRAAGVALAETFDENSAMFVNSNLNHNFRTFAHELGHILTNTGDTSAILYEFFPYDQPPPQDTKPTQRRRLPTAVSGQVGGAQGSSRTLRASGAGHRSDVGNRILKDP